MGRWYSMGTMSGKMVTIVHDLSQYQHVLSQYQHVLSVVFFGRLTSQGLGSLNILTPVCSKYWGFDLCNSFLVPPLILWLSDPAAVCAAGWALLTETTFGVGLHLDSSFLVIILHDTQRIQE